MTGRLSGKVCFITGATGIAEATARRFADEGALLFVASLHEKDCAELAERISGLTWIAADFTDEAQVELAFAACVEKFQRIDALFATVGGSGRPFGDAILHDVSLDAWRASLALNLDTAFLSAREATRIMRNQPEGGSVVSVSSVAATHPVPGVFDALGYATAKGGINALTVNSASQYASAGIRFNAIAPGLTDTPLASKRALSDPDTIEVTKRKMQLPGGGPLQPADIAELAVFLCSDESRNLTGQIIRVDGGWGVS